MGRLFGTAGIRGRYPDEVGPELAFGVGASVAWVRGARLVVVGGDGRLTTPVLKAMVSAGAMVAGADVVDAGLVPMPALPWAVVRLGADAGIYITASHNPPTDNGIKVFRPDGAEFTRAEEGEVEDAYFSRSWEPAPWDRVGKLVSGGDLLTRYIAEVAEAAAPKEVRRVPRVVVDTANGAASLATPRVLKDIGADVFTFNSNVDGRFPGRYPEPRADVLEPLLPAARALGADVFLAHDGDGDRLAVIDPAKGFVKQDRVIALLARWKLSQRGGTVIVSIDVGRAVRDVVEAMGGKLRVVRLGKLHEGLLEAPDAVMAAEPWKFIDPSWGKWIDGVYQAATIVRMMAEEGKTIGELLAEIPDYPQARVSIKVPKDVRDKVYESVAQELISSAPEGAEVTTIDGVRIDYPDGSWILLRKSGTEPKIRIYGEAPGVGDLRRRVEGLKTRIIMEAKRLGAADADIKVTGSIKG